MGEVKPVEDGLHWAARGRAHQGWQRGVAVADRGDRVALPPALVPQRRARQGMGRLGHAAHHGEAPGGVALMLDLAADRLEVPSLVCQAISGSRLLAAIIHEPEAAPD